MVFCFACTISNLVVGIPMLKIYKQENIVKDFPVLFLEFCCRKTLKRFLGCPGGSVG